MEFESSYNNLHTRINPQPVCLGHYVSSDIPNEMHQEGNNAIQSDNKQNLTPATLNFFYIIK